MSRPSIIHATLDPLIEELIADRYYDVRIDGTVWTQITETGKVSVSGEWRRTESLNTSGYPKLGYRGSHILVHRVVYRRFNGPLSPNLVVNHIDGNRTNSRPGNLELVTTAQNNLHRFRVMGHPAVIGNFKISDEIADSIRRDHEAGSTYRVLCLAYGLSKSSISYIINRRTWNRRSATAYKFEYRPKLTLEKAEEIRSEYRGGASMRSLAMKHGLGLTTVKYVISGRTWKAAA